MAGEDVGSIPVRTGAREYEGQAQYETRPQRRDADSNELFQKLKRDFEKDQAALYREHEKLMRLEKR